MLVENEWVHSITSGGVLTAQIGGGTLVNGPTIAANWHLIEAQVDVSANSKTLSRKVDGVAQTQATGAQAATTFTFTAYGGTAPRPGDEP